MNPNPKQTAGKIIWKGKFRKSIADYTNAAIRVASRPSGVFALCAVHILRMKSGNAQTPNAPFLSGGYPVRPTSYVLSTPLLSGEERRRIDERLLFVVGQG